MNKLNLNLNKWKEFFQFQIEIKKYTLINCKEIGDDIKMYEILKGRTDSQKDKLIWKNLRKGIRVIERV